MARADRPGLHPALLGGGVEHGLEDRVGMDPGDRQGWGHYRRPRAVLESDPYRRLSYAWHTFTPEWAAAYDVSDEDLVRFASERRSKVTFDLEPLGEMVKLTVVHDGFDAGSAILPGITEGWPRILSDLKTLLETGDTLPVG